MKKFKVENMHFTKDEWEGRIQPNEMSYDFIGDYVDAENEDEAIELAIEYFIDNRGECDVEIDRERKALYFYDYGFESHEEADDYKVFWNFSAEYDIEHTLELCQNYSTLSNDEIADCIQWMPDWSYLDDRDCRGYDLVDELEERSGLDRADCGGFEQLIEDALQKLCGRGIVEW